MTEIDWEEDIADPGNDSGDYDLSFEEGERDPDYTALFAAPDYAALTSKPQTRQSRDYERKVQSLLKAGVTASLARDNFPDAAAFLKHGPKFARAVGDASENDRVRRAVDMITAPDSPMIALVLTGVALTGQLLRNHQDEAEKAAANVRVTWRQRRANRKAGIKPVPPEDTPRMTIRLPFGRKLSFNVRIRVPGIGALWHGITGSAMPPDKLAYAVFSDSELLKALRKQGIIIQQRGEDD